MYGNFLRRSFKRKLGVLSTRGGGGGQLQYSLAMDNSLWSKLPEGTLELVFARLPLKDIMRLRSLNKHWNSFIYSPVFQQVFEEVSSARFGIVTKAFSGTELPSYAMFHILDTLANTWFQFSNSSFPLNVNPIATAGGLVCMYAVPGCRSQASGRVFVCNPITNSCKELPIHHMPGYPVLARMEIDKPTRQYRIILMCKLQDELSFEVYNSATNCWSIVDTNPTLESKIYKSFSVSQYKGLAKSDSQHRALCGLPRPDPTYGEAGLFWREVLNESSDTPGLAYAWGWGAPGSKGSIWELQTSGFQWKKVASVPEWLEEVDVFEEPNLFVSNGVIVLSERGGDSYSYEPYGYRVSLFEMSKQTWKEAPTLFLPFCGVEKELAEEFAFEIKWDAIP